jgi:DNA-binding winged helix-turn-helix (wHTH) protein/tetratricopeptide (TPR) repeat protein
MRSGYDGMWKRYGFGDFVFDVETGALTRQGERVSLSPKASVLLNELLDSAGRLISSQDLLERVWPDARVTGQSLTVRVNELRKVLGDTAKDSSFIDTVSRRGYRFVAKVRDESPRTAEPWVRPAIGVLRFVSSETAGLAEDVAQGLCAALLRDLSAWGQNPVVSQSAVALQEGSLADARHIGRALDAGFVLDGRVEQGRDRVRVSFQFAETGSGRRLAAGHFDLEGSDPLALQDRAAARVVNAVSSAIHKAGSRPRPEAARQMAWDHTARGHWYYEKGTQDANERSRACYLDALELDPFSPASHYDAAWSHGMDIICGWSESRETSQSAFDYHAERALELDGSMAITNKMMGFAMLCRGDPSGALPYLQRAEALDPADPLARVGRSWASLMQGNPDEARPVIEQAVAEIGEGSSSGNVLWLHAVTLMALDDFDGALASTDRAATRLLAWPLQCTLAIIHVRRGRFNEAARAIARARELHPGVTTTEAVKALNVMAGQGHLESYRQDLKRAGLPA